MSEPYVSHTYFVALLAHIVEECGGIDEMAKALEVNAAHVRAVLSGAVTPSSELLNAMGYQRCEPMYQPKVSSHQND